MVPEVGSVWRNGDEERYVYETSQNRVGCVAKNYGFLMVLKFKEWSEWSAGAVQVYPPPAVPQGSGETVHHLTDADLDAIARRMVEIFAGTPMPVVSSAFNTNMEGKAQP